ncbi:hypothetical protein NYE54_33005 [Paenibacillus sp. FSL K6-1330]|uniref:hypothetical protein n=1 Tax=Paenibacillus sp. FSL K6-1330 TaxID=2975292 RepID=UPI0030D79D9A
MQYLNVLLESLDDENQAYFYGERLVIDYVLLTAIQREVEEVNKRLREEIYRLMNNIVGSLQWCGVQKKIVVTFRSMDIIGFIIELPIELVPFPIHP